MDANEFRKRGKEMVDLVADYLENIRDRRPLADVQPGYLRQLIPAHAPEEPETWESLVADIERVIMPGVTHWHSPQFHAYFPTSNSYPAICADILSAGIACIGFTWISSPACTELEVVMMDWLANMLQLPEAFLSGKNGGGIIQGTASEATLVALLAARSRKLGRSHSDTTTTTNGFKDEEEQPLSRLVAYCSDEAHCSVERACLLGAVRCHKVPSNDHHQMTGQALAAAIETDMRNGLVPFYCVATLGTTSTCAFDKLLQIGPVCEKYGIWLHIDAAYAGSSFICPEFRPLLDGVEMAQSFNFNPHKWLRINFDCSAMWFKDSSSVVNAFKVDPVYLKHAQQERVPDYRHWQIPLGRRFRSLKMWFVFRLLGVKSLRAHIRKHIQLAQEFKKMVQSDDKFEVTHPVTMGLVCFRLKGVSNELNATLLTAINADGRIHLIASTSKGLYFLRLAICSSETELSDIQFSWSVICEVAARVLDDADTYCNTIESGH